MLYSCIGQFRLKLPCLFVAAALLYGCGNGDHNAVDAASLDAQPGTIPENDDPQFQAPSAVVTLSTNEGGYVINGRYSIFCDVEHEFCDINTAYGSIESLTAISRFGHSFLQWQQNHSIPVEASTNLQLIADRNVSVEASFQKLEEIANPVCIATPEAARFRTLHLGDSLTATQCWGRNCPSPTAINTQAPEREAIQFYETSMANNTDSPRVIAVGGHRINGTNVMQTRASDEAIGFEMDHYWKLRLEQFGESVEDFDAATIALGTNDLNDYIDESVDMEFIFEQRVRPLLQWLGNRPVLWIMPHYSHSSFSHGNLNLYAKPDGLACACADNAPATTECNLATALQQCDATEEETHNTIARFKAIHEFRQRLSDLQNEYSNLYVVDAAQLIAEQSHGNYDLYQQLLRDNLHFSPQGVEWYSWTHAYLAQIANPACNQPTPVWSMGTAEVTMMALLSNPES